MRFSFPPIYAVYIKEKKNRIIQLLLPARNEVEIEISEYSQRRIKGYLLKEPENNETTLLITNSAKPPDEFDSVVRVRHFDRYGGIEDIAGITDIKKWIKHPLLKQVPDENAGLKARTQEVKRSWVKSFRFKEEVKDKKGRIRINGLRTPQLGAIHATLSHWIVTNKTATIVMPTGTGKTEAMLSILVKCKCDKLLVVVPTDALREQIAGKFITLGVLKDYGIVSRSARYPIVGIVKQKFKSQEEVDSFFEKCNVVITTMNIAGQSEEKIQEHMVSNCSHLFIDEAHHTEAPTWKEFKMKFEGKKILQFTATPYRNDGKELDGEIIFDYPLRKAQEEGYYEKIKYRPVNEYDPRKWDEAIARKAVSQLIKDREKGYDHILMPRVNDIKRAKEVFSIYDKMVKKEFKSHYKKFNPVQIHTGIKSVIQRECIRRKILNKESRIVVCVDMLGEGFDLPELKIAAFHDIRKSMPITLQLIGRFVRPKLGLIGPATVIANKANVEVEEELRDLYAQDADWDCLLPIKSQRKIVERTDLWQFFKKFDNFPGKLRLQNLKPALSTVIYPDVQDWNPKNFLEGLKGYDKYYDDINQKENILLIIAVKKIPQIWGKIKEFFDLSCDLYIVHWDDKQKLLFIHSSNTSSYYKALAEAVGAKAKNIRGEDVFRCFSGIDRPKLYNVGLKELLRMYINYTMRTGRDVARALTDAQKANTSKAVLFGIGYEDGYRTSIGCSSRGRIWSYRRTNIKDLIQWFKDIGKKVLDDSIDVEDILTGILIPKLISKRPDEMPIAVDWPEEFFMEPETRFRFTIDDKKEVYLYEADIKLMNPSKEGDLKFAICFDESELVFKLELFKHKNNDDYNDDYNKDYRFVNLSGKKVIISYGKKEKKLEDYFYENPPTIWFVDGASLEGNLYTELKKKPEPYEKDKILVWDWDGINITKESQGITKESYTIQHRVIKRLKEKRYDVIFDDDSTGESADVVAIKTRKRSIQIDFYHCKFSSKIYPGSRIEDLYEVCGQAQKSIRWMEQPTEIFSHLLRREAIRKRRFKVSRFEKGTSNLLEKAKEMSRKLPVHLSIYIVQPGLSKIKASPEQLELLAVTENYLMETRKLPFSVIANA